MITRKKITQILTLTNQTAGDLDVTEELSGEFIGLNQFIIVYNITGIAGAPTNVSLTIRERISGTIFASHPASTITTTGVSQTAVLNSLGTRFRLSVSFTGGTTPNVSGQVFIVGYGNS